MSPASERRVASALPVLGAFASGLAALVWLDATALSAAGLALPLLAMAASLLALGPLALAERQLAAEPADPLDGGLARMGELGGLLALAALGAPALAGGLGLGWVGLGWLGAFALPTLLRRPIAGPVAALAAIAVLAPELVAIEAAPWTLLQARWSAWDATIAGALTLGALTTGAGLGVWSGARPEASARPRRAPLLASGLVWGALALHLVVVGAAFEADAPMPGREALWLAALLGAAYHPAIAGRRHLHAVLGFAACLWLAGPAAPAFPVFWGVFPIFPALSALRLARRTSGGERVGWGGLALSCVAAIGLGWPSFPDAPLAGAALAALAVAVVALAFGPAARAWAEGRA